MSSTINGVNGGLDNTFPSQYNVGYTKNAYWRVSLLDADPHSPNPHIVRSVSGQYEGVEMLQKLAVKNYRLFEQLKIDALARVNLIVGTNNSGKSSLLEAIHLLTSDNPRGNLLFVLRERGEFVPGIVDLGGEKDTGGYQISQLFHGRTLTIGSLAEVDAGNSSLRMSIQKLVSVQPSLPFSEHRKLNGDEFGDDESSLIFERRMNGFEPDIDAVKIMNDGLLSRQSSYRKHTSPALLSRFITTNYLDHKELAQLWDKIVLTPKEDRVVEALQILEPQVERISFTSRHMSNSGILIRLKNEETPIPLGSMGDGMRRVLAIAASLVSIDDGTLLIDEIDTGLYYGVLKDMWRLIFETAEKQDAQVFATTHSWDCVKAFQQALSESSDEELGRLIRLDVAEGRVTPVSYSSRELDIAIGQGIEVR